MKAKLHHVGIAVRDLEKAVAQFETLFDGKFRRAGPELAKQSGLMVAADWRIGIELVTPIDGATQESAVRVREFLDTRGEGVFGMVHDVEKLSDGEERAERAGYRLLSRVIFAKDQIDEELGGAFERFEESMYDTFDDFGCTLGYQVMEWKPRS